MLDSRSFLPIHGAMTSFSNDQFARFLARPARFEQDADTRENVQALAAGVCRHVASLGYSTKADLLEALERRGLSPLYLPRLSGLESLPDGPLVADQLAVQVSSDALSLMVQALNDGLIIERFDHPPAGWPIFLSMPATARADRSPITSRNWPSRTRNPSGWRPARSTDSRPCWVTPGPHSANSPLSSR